MIKGEELVNLLPARRALMAMLDTMGTAEMLTGIYLTDGTESRLLVDILDIINTHHGIDDRYAYIEKPEGWV